jgi:hypothetical protein
VPLFGTTLKFALLWSNTLTRSPIGFCSFATHRAIIRGWRWWRDLERCGRWHRLRQSWCDGRTQCQCHPGCNVTAEHHLPHVD